MVMIGVLLAGTLLAVLNQTLLSPALPAIMASLEVDATTVQWLTSGYSLVEAVIIPLSAVVPQFLRPGGLFLCSGILDRRLEEVQAAIGAAGLEILQVRTMEDWCQITARKV